MKQIQVIQFPSDEKNNFKILQMPEASATTHGILNSTDWNTFNNKLSSLSGAWLTTGDQSSLSGTKSGSFNLLTSGSYGLSANDGADTLTLGWTTDEGGLWKLHFPTQELGIYGSEVGIVSDNCLTIQTGENFSILGSPMNVHVKTRFVGETTPNKVVISGGNLTTNASHIWADTEGEAGSDYLDNILSQGTGQILFLRAFHTARTVVVRSGTGNILLNTSDFSLDDTDKTLFLMWSGSKWVEIGRGQYSETDPVFSAWDKSTGISITESQISDFGDYQTLSDNLTSLSGLAYVSDSFVKMTGANTFSLDTNTYQVSNAGLTDISALAKTDSNFIVGNGTNWIAESGATARTSLGLGTTDSPQFAGLGIGVAPIATYGINVLKSLTTQSPFGVNIVTEANGGEDYDLDSYGIKITSSNLCSGLNNTATTYGAYVYANVGGYGESFALTGVGGYFYADQGNYGYGLVGRSSSASVGFGVVGMINGQGAAIFAQNGSTSLPTGAVGAMAQQSIVSGVKLYVDTYGQYIVNSATNQEGGRVKYGSYLYNLGNYTGNTSMGLRIRDEATAKYKYGIYIDAPTAASDSTWGIYQVGNNTNRFCGNIRIDSDNLGLILGAGQDASIYYDGTNFIINPKEVGSGILDVLGTLQTDGYNSADGTAGATGTIDLTTATSITIKNGLVTAWA